MKHRNRPLAALVYVILPFCLLTLSTTGAAADEPVDESSEYAAWGRYLQNYYRVPIRMAGAVLDGQWLRQPGPLLAIGGVGLAFTQDQAIRDYWQDNLRNEQLDRISEPLYQTGRSRVQVAMAGTGYGIAALTGSAELAQTTSLAVQATLLAQLGTEATKALGGRLRPRQSPDDATQWREGGASFFSGHASSTWAMASVVAHRHPDSLWIRSAAYGWAGAVTLSRINQDGHWASDVLAGSLVGYTVGAVVVEMSPFANRRVVAMPLSMDGATGLSLSVAF